jgi:hypothetical protein
VPDYFVYFIFTSLSEAVFASLEMLVVRSLLRTGSLEHRHNLKKKNNALSVIPLLLSSRSTYPSRHSIINSIHTNNISKCVPCFTDIPCQPAAGLEPSLTVFIAFPSWAAANADAHWYSVKFPIIEGVLSPARLLGMWNSNLDQILSLSAFGRIQKGGGFMFLADKFKNFLAVSDTEAFFEHAFFKIGGFSSKSQHFIRAGSVNMLNMSKPGTIGLKPKDAQPQEPANELP